MRVPRSIQYTAAALALAGAGVLVWRSLGIAAGTNPDAPQGTLWLCRRPECGRDFTLSTKDLAAFYAQHPDSSPPCPACSKAETVRAVRCAGCERAFVPPSRSTPLAKGQARACPHCGTPLG